MHNFWCPLFSKLCIWKVPDTITNHLQKCENYFIKNNEGKTEPLRLGHVAARLANARTVEQSNGSIQNSPHAAIDVV